MIITAEISTKANLSYLAAHRCKSGKLVLVEADTRVGAMEGMVERLHELGSINEVILCGCNLDPKPASLLQNRVASAIKRCPDETFIPKASSIKTNYEVNHVN